MPAELSAELTAKRRHRSASAPLVVFKLGGDAVATAACIALAARRIAACATDHRVVVVTSARRGVTDALTRLAAEVEQAVGGHSTDRFEVDRAIACGEIVTAVLLSAALRRLGYDAAALDAQQAGIEGRVSSGAGRISRIRRARIGKLLDRDVIPVVAGFQVAVGGELRLLGRGGSDVTAVALAAALGAVRCDLLKQDGLCTADPKFDPTARPVGRTDFAGLAALLAVSPQVLHAEAARLAERHAVPLRFVPFPEAGEASDVVPEAARLVA